MIPAFKLLANNEDATAQIADRLLSLRLIDQAGWEADSLEIELDDRAQVASAIAQQSNRAQLIELPENGAVLDLELGFQGQPLIKMGRFILDELSCSAPPAMLSLRARAADLAGRIRAPRSEAHHATTLGALVAKLAHRSGLKPGVSPALSSISIPYLAQSAESDLHLLTRIARDHGAMAKISGGVLLLIEQGRTESLSGNAMPALPLTPDRLSEWGWERPSRGEYASVIARWQDVDQGKSESVTAGAGEPSLMLRHLYASREAALSAAKAKLGAARREKERFTATLAGFEGDLSTGAALLLEHIRPGIDGKWIITKLTHHLNGALFTEIEAERAGEETP